MTALGIVITAAALFAMIACGAFLLRIARRLNIADETDEAGADRP